MFFINPKSVPASYFYPLNVKIITIKDGSRISVSHYQQFFRQVPNIKHIHINQPVKFNQNKKVIIFILNVDIVLKTDTNDLL